MKAPETIPPPAQPPTGDADEVISRLLGKIPSMPAAAPVRVEGKVQTSEACPAPPSLPLEVASLVLAARRLLEQTRAALRQEPRAPETAEERKARTDRLLSLGSPRASLRRTGKR